MRFLCVLVCLLPTSQAKTLTPAWVELGSSAVVRVIVETGTACPPLTADRKPIPMKVRQPVPAGFQPVCEAIIPTGARRASIEGQRLALPRADPKRIAVLGDTGCRLQGARIQACNDPSQWPFQAVANRAAADKPELILHVGDYLYREEPCPAGKDALCGGSPHGDNWESWRADFFTPAAKLLAAAPWVMSRGNHEDCRRAWRGFFYYLDPRPWNGSAPCQAFTDPYVVTLGAFQVVALDSSSVATDRSAPDQVALFTAQLKSLQVKNAWLIDHHPFWAFTPDLSGKKMDILSLPLENAWENANPQGISLVLSGHTHLFEILGFAGGRPPQIVAGDAGTQLTFALSEKLNGKTVHGAAVVAADTRHEFGYSQMQRKNRVWTLRLLGVSGGPMVRCTLDGAKVECW
jgi:Calcineurin-like phosphoesterase